MGGFLVVLCIAAIGMLKFFVAAALLAVAFDAVPKLLSKFWRWLDAD